MKHCITLCFICLLSACATKFSNPSNAAYHAKAGSLSASEIFAQSFIAHGGDKLPELKNLNVGLTGKWKHLIRRIQPLVTDYKYRVDSQERLLPQAGIYAANYVGPAGQKWVFRTPDDIEVVYNKNDSFDKEVLSSTALTADSFYLFLLGPLALEKWRSQFARLSDIKFKGKTYSRLYLKRQPGFGKSVRDEVVLWIDPQSKLTKMVQITLEGHSTTKGAYVEVEYLDYVRVDNYTFPSKYFERVKAPIAIDAHAWELSGIDINRDYDIEALRGEFKGTAKRVADPSGLKNNPKN